MTSPLLDRQHIERAFAALSDRLARRKVHADLYIVGGAAIALAWDERRTTRDIDAVFQTDRHQVLLEEIWAVADALGLPRSWLNEQASAYVPNGTDRAKQLVWDSASLRVVTAGAPFVLAMKVRAGRPSDRADIALLIDRLRLTTIGEVIAIHDAVFPDDPLADHKREAVIELLER
jgi:Nucleotidyltransferase of unknown function (DUF6036)